MSQFSSASFVGKLWMAGTLAMGRQLCACSSDESGQRQEYRRGCLHSRLELIKFTQLGAMGGREGGNRQPSIVNSTKGTYWVFTSGLYSF